MSKYDEKRKQIIERTRDYICNLPNGSNLTLWRAVEQACPDIDQEYYDVYQGILDEIDKTDTVVDYSDHEGKFEGLLYNLDFFVWHKRLQKVQIVSDLTCYGPMPEPDDPAEQHLTISSTGQIWFSEYLFGDDNQGHRKTGRQIQSFIGKGRTARILSYVADYFEAEIIPDRATDIGTWEMTAYKTDGTRQSREGSMVGSVQVKNTDLNELIHDLIPIKNLRVFG